MQFSQKREKSDAKFVKKHMYIFFLIKKYIEFKLKVENIIYSYVLYIHRGDGMRLFSFVSLNRYNNNNYNNDISQNNT